MQRTAWGFGDGDAGSGAYDPGDPAGNVLADHSAADLAQLIALNDARQQLPDAGPVAQLQSHLAAIIPAGAGLPLALLGAGVVALLMIPDGRSRRR